MCVGLVCVWLGMAQTPPPPSLHPWSPSQGTMSHLMLLVSLSYGGPI